MPSIDRRTLLASSGALLTGLSGCAAFGSSTRPAHWVSVYLVDSDVSRNVDVTITNADGEVLFERAYTLSADNEANEDAPFPRSSEPETVVVTVDGSRFERDWPGFESPQLPCDDPNWAGIELWIETDTDGAPELRLLADCQHVTVA